MIKEAIIKIVNKGDLTYDEAHQVMMEIMKGRPEMAETYKTFKVMIEGGLLPSNIEFCIQMMMLTIFSGSLLTIVLIPLVKLRFRGFNKRNFQ